MRKTHGFTLIELLVVIVIFSGIMGALMIAFLISQSSYNTSDAYIQVQQETRRAFDTMIKELREAGWDLADAVNPGTGGNCTFAAPLTSVTVSTAVSTTCAPAGVGVQGNQIDFRVALGYDLAAQFPTPPNDCPATAICWGAPDLVPTNAPHPNWSVRYWIDTVTVPQAPQMVRDVYNQAGALQVNQRRIIANGVNSAFTRFSYTAPTVTIRLEINARALVTGGTRIMNSTSPGTPVLQTTVTLRN